MSSSSSSEMMNELTSLFKSSSLAPDDISTLLPAIHKSNPTWAVQAALAISSQSSFSQEVVQITLDTIWECIRNDKAASSSNGSSDWVREVIRRRNRFQSWITLSLAAATAVFPAKADALVEEVEEEIDFDDDPWAEENQEEEDDAQKRRIEALQPAEVTPSPSLLPFNLTTFLSQPISSLALSLLLSTTTPPTLINILVTFHRDELWPYRFDLLNAIPTWVWEYQEAPDGDWNQLIVGLDEKTGVEATWFPSAATPQEDDQLKFSVPLSSSQLTDYYIHLIEKLLDQSGGYVSPILALTRRLMHHGKIQGLASLEADIQLLKEINYDCALLSTPKLKDEDFFWSLKDLRTYSPSDIIRNGLLHSCTSSTISALIITHVEPYISGLSASSRKLLLEDYILGVTDLELLVAIFENSKATIEDRKMRVIKTDEGVARLALSLMYGSERTDAWSTFSSIFECMPAWSFPPSSTPTTQTNDLAKYIQPLPDSLGRHRTAKELYSDWFQRLDVRGLSDALDAVDVHLESAEILSRYLVPAPLSWFILSSTSAPAQLGRAKMLVRRFASSGLSQGDNEWAKLRRDVSKLREAGGAFGLLDERETDAVVLEGVLSSGNFGLARSLLRPQQQGESSLMLTELEVHDIVMASSLEFYQNAESGNVHYGGMKLAYDCLDVVSSPTRAIIEKKEFIEATSKLSTYTELSNISPIEILSLPKPSRLDLISRILSTSDDAFKHPDVILELVDKLGFKGNLSARIKVLGMLADACSVDEEWEMGAAMCERMVMVLKSIRSQKKRKLGKHGSGGNHFSTGVKALTNEEISEATEVTWKSCFQFGRLSSTNNNVGEQSLSRRLSLLGSASELTPSETIPDVLAAWQKVEDAINAHGEDQGNQQYHQRQTYFTYNDHKQQHNRNTSSFQSTHSRNTSSTDANESRSMLGSKRINQFTSDLIASNPLAHFRPLGPSGGGGRSVSPANPLRGDAAFGEGSGGSGGGSGLFTKGVGWLLGASEEEMGGGPISHS